MTGPVAVLERIRRQPARPRPGECCDLCGTEIADHRHLVDLEDRTLRCACRACAFLFEHPGAAGGRYRTVPDRWVTVGPLDRSQWEDLRIPVEVVFVFVSSAMGGPAAFYPGPAGATESQLSLDAWTAMARAHPALAAMEADVEAALILSEPEPECFVVPIDACYELVGRLRRTWRGFDGGNEARFELEQFFARVRRRA